MENINSINISHNLTWIESKLLKSVFQKTLFENYSFEYSNEIMKVFSIHYSKNLIREINSKAINFIIDDYKNNISIKLELNDIQYMISNIKKINKLSEINYIEYFCKNIIETINEQKLKFENIGKVKIVEIVENY